MRIILTVAITLFLVGCASSPSADVIKALAGDPSSICFIGTSPWGGVTLDRNHGCPGNQGGTAIIAPASMNMQVIKP